MPKRLILGRSPGPAGAIARNLGPAPILRNVVVP